jgi:TetR/AcrR family transcriptional repressor of nem operon
MSTREDILDSSERFARQKGYNGFSLAQLADEVGIRKASIYHHFKSKSDILLALLQRYTKGEYEFLDEVTAEHDLARDRLEAFIIACREDVSDGELMDMAFVFMIDPSGLSAPIQQELAEFYKTYIGWFQDMFELAQKDKTITGVVDAEAEAYALYALTDGAMALASVQKDATIFDKAVKPLEARLR